MAQLKAITFDFWSTLYRGNAINGGNRIRRIKQSLEADRGTTLEATRFEQLVSETKQVWQHYWEADCRTLNSAEWLDVLLNKLELSITDQTRHDIVAMMEDIVFENPPQLIAGGRELLADLATKYKLAIISDTGITPGRILRQIMTSDGVLDYFSHLTFSDELGRSKPHARAFQSTLAALDAAPTEAVHIGDLLRTDIAGAKGFGMRAIQYTGISVDTSEGVMATPDAVIERYAELLPLLNNWFSNEAV